VKVDRHQREVSDRLEAVRLQEGPSRFVLGPARCVKRAVREIARTPDCSLEESRCDSLAGVLGVDADVADDVPRLGPDLGEADHVAVFDKPGIQRRVGSRPGQPLVDLVLGCAANALVRERAAAHERGQACDVVERRSSNLHRKAPFGTGVGPTA
jgi:hypothetical protein